MSLPLKDAQINGFANTFDNHFHAKNAAEIEQTLLKTVNEFGQQFLAEQLANTLACCDTQTPDAYTAAANIYKASGDNNRARQFYKKTGESYTAAGNNSAAAASYAEADNLPSDL